MGTYLVTGASRGIGRCLIERLAADPAGHELIALGRSAESLADLPVSGRVVADLGEPSSLAGALPAIEQLDGLVHSAGIARRSDLVDSSIADWEAHLRLNLVAVAELTRLLLPALRTGGGTVVLVNSVQGLLPRPNSTVYAASKAALRSLADTLRAEEPTIRVSTLYPARVATDMQRDLRAQENLPFEPENYIRPETAALVIAQILALPPDSEISDLTLRPAGHST